MSEIGRRRERAKEEGGSGYLARRRRLLTAAAEVFRSRGYDGVRMDVIAAHAGTDRATLYYYFSNKQELFRELIIDAVEVNVRSAREIAASDLPAREKLRRLVVELLDSYQRHYPYMFVYVQEDLRRIITDETPQAEQLVALGVEYENTVADVIREGCASGEFRATAPPRVIAYAVIGAANWTHRWYDPEKSLSGAEVGGVFADLFISGLVPDELERSVACAS
jgi:AcrR family transcriptional regulator